MKRTRYEQEVIINFNAESDMASIYTANPAWIRKMGKLSQEFPDTYRLVEQAGDSATYEVPKRLVRMGKPKKLSEAQKENLEKMRIKASNK